MSARWSSSATRARHALALIRRTPFDTATAEGRAKERDRRIAITIAATVSVRAISMLSSLIAVPLTVGYLGAERFGLWLTISAVISMLTVADLGIGNGLLNAVAAAHGKDDRPGAVAFVSSAFFLLAALALLLGLAFAVAYPWIPWSRVFNLSSPRAISEVGPAVAVFAACVLMSMPLGVVERTRSGYQEGFANALFAALGGPLMLAGVLLVTRLEAGLPWLVLVLGGTPVLALVANGIVLFRYRRPWLRPRLRRVTSAATRSVLSTGVVFMLLQVVHAMAFYVDALVATHLLGPAAVTQFSVPLRLFALVPMVVSILYMAAWPAYGEAIARGDGAWVRRTLTISLKLALLITSVPSLLLVLFGEQLIHLWVGAVVDPTLWLLLGLACWVTISGVGGTINAFLNGANALKPQLASIALVAASTVVAQVLFVEWLDFGVAGIAWGKVVPYLLFTILPYAVLVPRLLANVDRQAAGRGPTHSPLAHAGEGQAKPRTGITP